MALGPNYKVKPRRRREGKTNYYKRYVYVLSRAIRLVVRLTNEYVIVSVMKFDPKGDITIASAHSIELVKKYGWKGDTNNTPAAYLTGFLAGLRAKKAGIESAVADIGLFTPTKGARVFYAIKGALDAGLKVPMGDIELDENRIKGVHISEYAKKLEAENPEKFNKLFSRYLSRGLNPKDLPSHFEEVLNKIKSSGE
ncbi:50S ribosomal protein L18 [Acidianus ambivalens]|jgi:large subunit ribosomal protein L18|uniref:Large ribosomal subunit protein uL18 n=1 Tax=Acidianus ambivalens TaxID=2283 RepID=A0A650CYV7_ACIAM|nr:50S ribosomal protein L18 [Acidianus ambivalens]MQL54859.1 50S ribosomal protein L18 [Acidianus ambivalens]QGR22647.1 50S ribosomal protein L18 [Acidianus ambivalens]